MRKIIYPLCLLATAFFVTHFVYAQAVAIHPPNTFHVAVSSAITQPVSGRMLLFMKCASSDGVVDVDLLHPESIWIAAQEVHGLTAGSPVEFHADTVVYPKPFAEAPACPWEVQVVLDVNHSYNRNGREDTDWESAVTPLTTVWDEPTLTLDRHSVPRTRMTALMGIPAYIAPAAAELFEVNSTVLSRFWGKPVSIRAWVVLPPGYDRHPPPTGRTGLVCHRNTPRKRPHRFSHAWKVEKCRR